MHSLPDSIARLPIADAYGLYYYKYKIRGIREKEHMSKTFVTINGTVYDKVTGLPVRSAADATKHTNRGHAKDIHARTQRSQTLSRKHVKREPAKVAPHKAHIEVTQQTDAAPLPAISKYAPHPVTSPTTPATTGDVIAPATTHPIVAKAAAHHAHPQAVKRTHKPSDVIKAEATAKALAEAPSHHRAPHRDKHATRSRKQRFGRALSFASSGVAVLMIAGYFTYVNMPNLSVRVAAVQAGVDAQYPSYRPSGYSLSGPVAYENGQVRMAFVANGTNQNFTLSQAKSGWDSSALLENYVEPKAGADYLTTTEGGLTIYSWGGNAAWVSKGILHTVDGDAPLSPDQIYRMAASL